MVGLELEEAEGEVAIACEDRVCSEGVLGYGAGEGVRHEQVGLESRPVLVGAGAEKARVVAELAERVAELECQAG